MRHPQNATRSILCAARCYFSRVLHLQAVVSRKTPADGRLEIPESLADRLSASENPLVVSLPGSEFDVRVEAMACTCAKGAGGNHRHYFLSAEALKALPPGANVNLVIDVDEGLVRIEVASS